MAPGRGGRCVRRQDLRSRAKMGAESGNERLTIPRQRRTLRRLLLTGGAKPQDFFTGRPGEVASIFR